MEKKTDYNYLIVLIVFIIVIIGILIYFKYLSEFIKIPQCTIFTKTGIYCPGCGGTRAVYSLYKGNILKSLYYNPIVLYIIVILFWYIITEGISKILNKKNKLVFKDTRKYIWIGFYLILINWIIKIAMQINGIL